MPLRRFSVRPRALKEDAQSACTFQGSARRLALARFTQRL